MRISALLFPLMLAACASVPPEQVVERLDSRTGTTVTRLGKPLELLAAAARARDEDPFAFIAPFEVNRMGERSRYLWVSAPAATQPPALDCAGQRIALEPVELDLAALAVSEPPYAPPAPWSSAGYFALDRTLLDCLADDPAAALVTGPEPSDRFVADRDRTADVRAFTDRITP